MEQVDAKIELQLLYLRGHDWVPQEEEIRQL